MNLIFIGKKLNITMIANSHIYLYNEKPTIDEIDFLPHDRVIDTIEAIISSNGENKLKKKVLLLDGVWGSGKTSVLDKLSTITIEGNDKPKYSKIFFDAWNASYSILLKEFARGFCREILPDQNVEILKDIDTSYKDMNKTEFNGGLEFNITIAKGGLSTSGISQMEYTPQGDFTPHTFKEILKCIKFGNKPVLVMIDNMDRLDDNHVISYQDAVYTLITECEELDHEIWFIVACDVSQFKNKQRAYFDRISAMTVTLSPLNTEMARRFFIKYMGLSDLVDRENNYSFDVYDMFRSKAEILVENNPNFKITHTPRLIKRVINQYNIQSNVLKDIYGKHTSAALIVACAEVFGLINFLLDGNFTFDDSNSKDNLFIPMAQGDTEDIKKDLSAQITSLVYKEPVPTKTEWRSFLKDLNYSINDKTMANKIAKKLSIFGGTKKCQEDFVTSLMELVCQDNYNFYNEIYRYFPSFIDMNTNVRNSINTKLAVYYIFNNDIEMLVKMSRIWDFKDNLFRVFVNGVDNIDFVSGVDKIDMDKLICTYLDMIINEESYINISGLIITPSEYKALSDTERRQIHATNPFWEEYKNELNYIFTSNYMDLIYMVAIELKDEQGMNKEFIIKWLKKNKKSLKDYDKRALHSIIRGWPEYDNKEVNKFYSEYVVGDTYEHIQLLEVLENNS